ncbi:hypothetical protein NPL7_03500 [Metamycoplasma hyosynoviae]|uniref:hypothetical protein n=1 Tax=Metamycoplasma hyosynoviae TaxID=29559 RepID=UPI00046207FF|nr:hypothetical protein [Metamycoplasma hyosynoviae]KDE41487.1 hypothetical protein NPL7_03500 [Metamycoplasma hyosynoviae]KDE42764.1 hypothetical protein NPL3_00730 [Metamycoplasma hyosynoviae]KDE43201.1 hypothetical protein NPL5_02855 [Metamycoplasma hyosynoviae]KDE44785.1 hypothetical protein NPL6_00805 [Metamycoplasma hyosynoviae]KDE45605.1 hypothetical protein NPL2_00245 [Metamycoplasma hyosynoviae]
MRKEIRLRNKVRAEKRRIKLAKERARELRRLARAEVAGKKEAPKKVATTSPATKVETKKAAPVKKIATAMKPKTETKKTTK